MLRNCVSFSRGHMLDATPVMGWVGNRAWKFAAERRGIPIQSVVHQVKIFTSEGPKIFRGVSNIAGTQTLDLSCKSLKTSLPYHMVLKHKDREHSTMHPLV